MNLYYGFADDDGSRVDFFIVRFGSFFILIGCCVWVGIYGRSFNWCRVIAVLSLRRLIGDDGFIGNGGFIDNLLIDLVSGVIVANGNWISFLSFDNYFYCY